MQERNIGTIYRSCSPRHLCACNYGSNHPIAFLLPFPMKRLQVTTLWRPKVFPLFLVLYYFGCFSTMISRSGTPPKSESGVGLMQFMSTRITACSSRRRMWPNQFHLLSLARIMTFRVGSRASSKLVRFVILESIFDIVPFIARRVCAVSFLDSHP